MSQPGQEIRVHSSNERGVAELRAALDALQTSLENLDRGLYAGVADWSPEAQAAREAALREWVDTARHMETILRGLESRGATSPGTA